MCAAAPKATRSAVLFAILVSGALSTCSDDPEVDLCDDKVSTTEEVESGSVLSQRAPGVVHLGVLAALVLRHGGSPLVPLAGVLLSAVGSNGAVSCGALKTFYKDAKCCGEPEKMVETALPGCPYNFAKPKCSDAEPQSPRDLSTGAEGNKTPKAPTLTDAMANMLPLVNVHFHLGAEHKSDDYNNASHSEAFDSGRRLAAGAVRPGFMCETASLSSSQLADYSFQHCKGDVKVGKSYEVHFVHSSAGYSAQEVEDNADLEVMDLMADGLGGAANGRGLLNPMIAVEGQVYQIVQGAQYYDDLLHGWQAVDHSHSVMYMGSTTGPSHNNEICSPYAITWHVDKKCHQVSPESFDKMCQDMKKVYKMEQDQYPHGSRILLDPRWVVNSTYVVPLA